MRWRMKAYLFSLPPVHAPARANELAFPFNQRWALAFWNLAFLDDHRFKPEPALSAGENRGAYLATALGHCGECHTPRNIGFAMEIGRQFGGAVAQGWHAYNITTDKEYGIGDWSDQQIADYLRFGHAAGRGSASGPMGEAVGDSLQYLTADDTHSLVLYLRHVEPQTGVPGTEVDPAPSTMTTSSAWAPGATDSQGELGRRLFEGVCASCHEWNGARAGDELRGTCRQPCCQRSRRGEPRARAAIRRQTSRRATARRTCRALQARTTTSSLPRSRTTSSAISAARPATSRPSW